MCVPPRAAQIYLVLSEALKDKIQTAVKYFQNQQQLMNYASHQTCPSVPVLPRRHVRRLWNSAYVAQVWNGRSREQRLCLPYAHCLIVADAPLAVLEQAWLLRFSCCRLTCTKFCTKLVERQSNCTKLIYTRVFLTLFRSRTLLALHIFKDANVYRNMNDWNWAKKL